MGRWSLGKEAVHTSRKAGAVSDPVTRVANFAPPREATVPAGRAKTAAQSATFQVPARNLAPPLFRFAVPFSPIVRP